MADTTFLDAIQVGAGIANRRMERDFRERQFKAQEAERAFRSRVAMQEMQLNDLKVNQITSEIAQRAKQQAELDLAYQGYAKDHAAGVPMEEALFKNFSGPAARYGSDPLEVARQAATFQREKVEGPLRQQKLQSEIASTDALTRQRETATEPELRSLTDPKTGKPITMIRTGPNSWAESRGEGEEVTFTTPEGAITSIKRGGRSGADGTTPSGVTAKAEERMIKNQKVVEELNSMARTLRPQDVGIKGVIGEALFDEILPQFGFPTADVRRMDNRTKLKATVEGALKMVSDDTRFSNADREAIKAILPKAGAKESYENAQQTVKTLSRIFAKRTLIDAKEIEKETPLWALEVLDAEGLQDAYRGGLITKEQALNAYAKRRGGR